MRAFYTHEFPLTTESVEVLDGRNDHAVRIADILILLLSFFDYGRGQV